MTENVAPELPRYDAGRTKQACGRTFFPVFSWRAISAFFAATKDAAAPTVGILISVFIPFVA